MSWRRATCCVKADPDDCIPRYSLGLPAGKYCDECWDKSGYRKEGREGYCYLDAGELYDDDY